MILFLQVQVSSSLWTDFLLSGILTLMIDKQLIGTKFGRFVYCSEIVVPWVEESSVRAVVWCKKDL